MAEDTGTNGQASAEERASEATVYDGRLFRRIMSFLGPYKGRVLVASVLVLGTAFLGALQPKLVQLAIDNHIVEGDVPGLLRIVGLLALVLVGQGIASFAGGYLTQWVGQQALYDLRTRVFRHIQRQPLGYFDRTPIGRLITRTTSDIEALSDLLSAGVVSILGSLSQLVFITYFMFTLNARLALVALAVMPLMFWATMTFRSRVRVVYRETRAQISRLNSFLQEHVTGMQVVQLFNREREEMRRFSAINDAHREAQVKGVFYYALFFPAVDIIAALALALVIWFGGTEAMRATLTVGVLIAFIQYVRRFFEPIRNLSDQYNTLQGAMAASERVFDVLDHDAALAEPDEPTVLAECRGRIEFENVWFAYETLPDSDEPNWVLRDVSFTVEPGQTVALVGATGSGKTTIINLLLRFYEVQRGTIRVDGVPIRDLALADLRRHIGLVLQDVFLFSGSLADNITLGDPAKNLQDVARAVDLVGADRFIGMLPDGLAHEIGERGVTLSHGQRQLVSFIRALVYDPAIIVLDEATSSVDTETEELVQTALGTLMDGRSALVVAHRLSTIQDAGQILVMHKGQVRERGTHQDLLAAGGLYRRLYELQYADQEHTTA
ncbi:MAG: ABC transporter ATP-binding protein [Bacteroidota bacterium]